MTKQEYFDREYEKFVRARNARFDRQAERDLEGLDGFQLKQAERNLERMRSRYDDKTADLWSKKLGELEEKWAELEEEWRANQA